MVRLRMAALTVKCFGSKIVPALRCTMSGPPVTPLEFLLCRHKQSFLVDSSGLAERSAASSQRAEGEADSLRSLMDQLLSED